MGRNILRCSPLYARNCPECAIVSIGGQQPWLPLHPIPVQWPFQNFGVDIMDLPRTQQGNKHVIVFQDFFTKRPIVYPVPDQKVLQIAQLFAGEIVPFFGVPEALLSDHGTNLLLHLVLNVCKLLGVKKLNTTLYYPQCDGVVERFNRTLKIMLRKHASKFGAQWDNYLPGPTKMTWSETNSFCGIPVINFCQWTIAMKINRDEHLTERIILRMNISWSTVHAWNHY